MASSYTSLLGLVLPVTGELSGTWGDTVNAGLTSLLDSAVAGTTTLSTDGDVTLTTTTGASNQARQAILLCSGARTAIRTITAPAQSKIYTVINSTTGGYSVKVVGVGPTTGVTIVAGESAMIAWNGSDFIKISNAGGAASFTDITVSGTATFSGGTANGVGYLNGSKVLTTGSALTFDGTKFNIGDGSVSNYINLNGSSVGGYIRGQRAGVSQWFVGDTAAALGSGTGLINYVYNDTPFIWYNGGAVGELMRLTTTGLGIGTSSPAQKLDVSGSTTTAIRIAGGTGAGYGAYAAFYAQGANAGYVGTDSGITGGGTSNDLTLYPASTNNIRFYQGGSEQMRLTSTGLGIGTSSPSYKLDVSSAAYPAGRVKSSYTSASKVYTSLVIGDSVTYKGGAIGYVEDTVTSANSYFHLTPWGVSEGNALTINQSANVGIGTTSPSAKLDIGNATANTTQMAGTTGGVYIYGIGRNGANGAEIDSYDAITFRTGSTSGARTGSEKMRLDQSGNLGLGVTPSAWGSGYKAFEFGGGGSALFGGTSTSSQTYLTANAFFNGTNWIYKNTAAATYYGQNAGVHAWYNNSGGTAGNAISFTQAMTLDASGNLLVGTTSLMAGSVNRLQLSDSANAGMTLGISGTPKAYVYASSAASNLRLETVSGYNVACISSTNGVYLANGATAWAALSDERKKDIIEPITGAAQKVATLRAVIGKYKTDSENKRRSFLIAQDVQSVLPEAVDASNPEELGLQYADTIPLLVAAIQEQQAIIDSLKARLDAANL